MVQFPQTDQEYANWIHHHPSGYVVNAHKKHSTPMVWHRADCEHLVWDKDVKWVEGYYLKACALDPGELAEWAKARSEQLQYCKDCQEKWRKTH